MTVSRQKGAPNAKWHISHAPVTERVLDILLCPEGASHEVGMEWEMRSGMRTGKLIAWCHTCRRVVLPKDQPMPKHPNGRRQHYQRDYARLKRLYK